MTQPRLAPGPFRADQLRSGDPYELSDGHALLCLPTGQRGSKANLVGGALVATDPAVESAGVDLGISTEPGSLRAPDVAVGAIEDEAGWAKEAPKLALEYADRGQDEAGLRKKIRELHAAGTRLLWVVRLEGERRVEVHEAGKPLRVVRRGGRLEAPGVLRNAVEVDELYDSQAGFRAVLRNLLQREGYADLDAVRSEGRDAGRDEGRLRVVKRLLEQKFGPLDAAALARLDGASGDRLDDYVERLLTAPTLAEVLGEDAPGE